MQCFGDEALRDLRAIGVCGVKQVNAEFDGAAQNTMRRGRVGGLAPCAISNQAHGAVAQPVNGEVAAEKKRAAGGRLG